MHAIADNSTIRESPKKHGSQAEQDRSESCPSWLLWVQQLPIGVQSMSVAPKLCSAHLENIPVCLHHYPPHSAT